MGDNDFDLTVRLKVEERLEAHENPKINQEIINIKQRQRTTIKIDILAFKADTLDVINQIFQALQIDNTNENSNRI